MKNNHMDVGVTMGDFGVKTEREKKRVAKINESWEL